MPITNHVTSLELSRRLKELKVPQRSHFVWVESEDDEQDCFYWEVIKAQEDNRTEHLSAFLASELGELLPAHYFTTKSSEIEDYWHCNSIENFFPDDFKKGIIADTECNCRAKMLIHLLENHLISVEELGK